MASEEQINTVAKGVQLIGSAEKSLDSARRKLTQLSRLYVTEAFKVGLIENHDCVVEASELNILAGEIANVEQRLYQFHARATHQLKAVGADAGLPAVYPILDGQRPSTKDGGGGR